MSKNEAFRLHTKGSFQWKQIVKTESDQSKIKKAKITNAVKRYLKRYKDARVWFMFFMFFVLFLQIVSLLKYIHRNTSHIC